VTPGTVVSANKDPFADEDSGDDTVAPPSPDALTPPSDKPIKKSPPPTDDQLNKALDMLKAKAA
jgi:hypothetical protein